MLLLPFVIALAAWRPRFADLGALATTIMLAILANAFICGALSNPHNRYGARMVWIASLAVLLVPLRAWRKGRRPAQGMIPTVFRKSMPSGATRGIMFGE
jgi:hypothetical protein